MSKHKSEVLTVKIQLKVKFPQAVITKIRTLPSVFRKMFRAVAWPKTLDSCSWHYVWKTINLCSGKVALTVFTEICSVSFFLEIKIYCSQKNSMGTDRENVVLGNLCVLKASVRYRQKPSFLSKNIYLYNLYYLAAPKTLNTRGEVLYFK